MKKLSKFLITIILTLLILIMLKKDINFKNLFYKKVFQSSLSFSKINLIYQNYFGKVLPFDLLSKDKQVFNEEMVINSYEEYMDGVKVKLENNLIPALKDGLVVFIGYKEDYGNTIIVNGSDGIDIWYSNLDNINVKLYDYITKGSLLALSNELILIYKKDGEVLNYNDYIN